MAHPRWPGFNTKTGNPPFDNMSRRMNAHMYRYVTSHFRLKGVVGRKRKKQLTRVEGGNMCKLYAAVYRDAANKHRKHAS